MFSIDEQEPHINFVVCKTTAKFPFWMNKYPKIGGVYKVNTIYLEYVDGIITPFLLLKGMKDAFDSRLFRDVNWAFGEAVCKSIEQQINRELGTFGKLTEE